ncbi:Uncharacterized protein Rs2_07216 [Raphanus sativus]|nr:Uncharacterized protein Rs2_07216 [Raphanus sativus]
MNRVVKSVLDLLESFLGLLFYPLGWAIDKPVALLVISSVSLVVSLTCGVIMVMMAPKRKEFTRVYNDRYPDGTTDVPQYHLAPTLIMYLVGGNRLGGSIFHGRKEGAGCMASIGPKSIIGPGSGQGDGPLVHIEEDNGLDEFVEEDDEEDDVEEEVEEEDEGELNAAPVQGGDLGHVVIDIEEDDMAAPVQVPGVLEIEEFEEEFEE